MKKIFTLFLIILMIFSLCACNMSMPAETTPSETKTSQSDVSMIKESDETIPNVVPTTKPVEEFQEQVNILDLAYEETHNALFREQNEATVKIVDRLFKHMEYAIIDTYVDGDEAIVTMWVLNINAGGAWERTLKKYAAASAENMFTNKPITAEDLYEYYLEELDDAFRKADMVIIPVVVEMELENYQWIWDFDDEVINAISGNLLAAIEGDLDKFYPFTITPGDLENWIWDINQVIDIFNNSGCPMPSEGGYITLDPECIPEN